MCKCNFIDSFLIDKHYRILLIISVCSSHYSIPSWTDYIVARSIENDWDIKISCCAIIFPAIYNLNNNIYVFFLNFLLNFFCAKLFPLETKQCHYYGTNEQYHWKKHLPTSISRIVFCFSVSRFSHNITIWSNFQS